MLLRCSTLLSQPRRRDFQSTNLGPPRLIPMLEKCMSHLSFLFLLLILGLL